MEARSVHFARPLHPVPERLAHSLASLVAALLIVGLILAAVALVGRRVAGGLSEPLSPIMLGITGVVAATMATGARRLALPDGRIRAANWVSEWLPGVALLAMAAAISLPESSPIGLAVLWIAVVAEEIWTWRQLRRHGQRGSPIERSIPSDSRRPPELDNVERLAPPASPAEVPPPVGDVVQQLVRTQSVAGIDRIHGWLKTTLAASERNATLHVAFCPPFEETPKFTVLQSSGPPARIKAVQLLPYGVRLELKRLEPGDKIAAILLEFSAEAPLQSHSADAARSNPQSRAPNP